MSLTLDVSGLSAGRPQWARTLPARLLRAQALPGARGHYDQQGARGAGHSAALRQLANRLVGIRSGRVIGSAVGAVFIGLIDNWLILAGLDISQ